MKAFNRILTAFIILIIIAVAIVNIVLSDNSLPGRDKPYLVDLSRITRIIENDGPWAVDLSLYENISDITVYSANDTDFFEADGNYLFREVNGTLFRFGYIPPSDGYTAAIAVNAAVILIGCTAVSLLFYVRSRILLPFDRLKEIPYELSKGNLILPVDENKNRYFGKFIWGIDQLRENLEQQKQRELNLQRDKQTLLLSLSHDIKTPLSAIKLYSSALSRGLYTEEKKQRETAQNITAKADEIEKYISQIIRASGEDFLHFEVSNTEFYLSELINAIHNYYKEKLSMVHIPFSVGIYTDCLLKGDYERSIEVLQNIIENSIKYGDGRFIEILFDEEDNCRLITVRNSGCTLSDAETLHIFDSFWRGSNSSGKSGSGLGLYICRNLMQLMTGDIYASVHNNCMSVTAVFTMA